MSESNPFDDAMDQATDEQDADQDFGEFDFEEFLDSLDDGKKSETIGIAVSEELHAVWKELRQDDNVDIDVAESIRQHLTNLAQRHQKATEKAGRKLQIEREL